MTLLYTLIAHNVLKDPSDEVFVADITSTSCARHFI